MLRTINQKVMLGGASVVALLAVSSGAGVWGSMTLAHDYAESETLGSLLQSHMHADMMHDALKSDVLAAITATDPTTNLNMEEVTASLREHADIFRKDIQREAELVATPGSKAALEKVAEPLATYIVAAEQIVELAKTNPAEARKRLPDFFVQFSVLEDAMSEVTDAIAAESGSAATAAKADAGLARTLTLAAAAICALALLALVLAARALVLVPMNRITAAMKRVAEGDHDGDLPYTSRADEIGAMAKALEVFRANAIEVVNLSATLQAESSSIQAAIQQAMAVAEYSLDGSILSANAEFLSATGYRLDELTGRNYSMLLTRERAASADFRNFWDQLARGQFASDKFLHVAKDGREIWLQAAFNPILDKDGKVLRIIQFATDITKSEVTAQENRCQVEALSGAQAVIEFELNGTIRSANRNFCEVMGYAEGEIVGKHHSIFVDAAYRDSHEYRNLWESLRRGEPLTDRFERIAKGGKKVWIQASYIPIPDLQGRPSKVIKFATDISATVALSREANFKSAAFDASPVPMMISDRDFRLLFVNASMKKMLKDNLDKFRQSLPHLDPENLIGQCIDVFHKNPAHQRNLLSDPTKLPYRRDTSIGDMKFGLNVSAVLDEKRAYVGNIIEFPDVTEVRLTAGKLEALERSQASVELGPDGTLLNANGNFCRALGYTLDELRGKHHSFLIDHNERQTADYRAFWEALGRGEFQAGKFRRIAKGGRTVWLQATYNPIVDANGKIYKIVEFATDITELENGLRTSEIERAARAEEQVQVVSALAGGLRRLAEGDLTHRLGTAFAADYEQLRSDFNEAMGRLQDAMRTIAVNTGGIRTGAGEISHAADDLSRRTEQQAASLEETAAALDEITATVKKTAEGAKQANAVVATTRADAEASGVVVRDTVSAMAEIERSSKQISQIIGVIDEIAFQTNLLALNAGVEAARAGDAGRGFAVVASEVRALAQRSSEAAKEIKGLILASSQHVETGVTLVGDAGKSLRGIVSKVGEISELVSEISSSAQEQSTALAEVNNAINQMDQVTQQNAAMVEQSTAASHSLTQEAEELLSLISRFQTGSPLADGSDSESRRQAARKPAGVPVKQQRQRVAQFVSRGNAAVKDDDWKEF